jgi:hypothetical protein
MRTALVVAFLLPQDDPAARLLRELDDDAIEVRDRAAAELVKMGGKALEPLRKAKSESEEVKARIAELIGRIERDLRRATFKGGEPANGLSAALRPAEKDRETWKAGEAVVLTLEVMNLESRPADFVPIQAWDRDMPEISFSTTGAHARVVARRKGPLAGSFVSVMA